jgi:hypothetical protein
MFPVVPFLPFIGPVLALALAMMVLVMAWRHRQHTGTLDPATRSKFIRRYQLIAAIHKHYGWLLLVVLLLLGILGAILRHE